VLTVSDRMVISFSGYGHLSPETPGGKIFCMIFALFGIPLNIMILKLVGDRIVSLIQCTLRGIQTRYFGKEISKLRSKTVTIILCLIVLMLFLGGVLYNLTEPWTFLDGFYFCFVTFTTIGFGDLVPNEGQ
jgi:phosphatidylglycerophosphate synthase